MQNKKSDFGRRKNCGAGISAPSHVTLDGRTRWKIPSAAASSSSARLCTPEKPPPITRFSHWKVPTEQRVWQEVQILSQMAKYSVFVEGFSWLLWSFFSFQIMSSGIRKHPEVKKRARHQRVPLPTPGVTDWTRGWMNLCFLNPASPWFLMVLPPPQRPEFPSFHVETKSTTATATCNLTALKLKKKPTLIPLFGAHSGAAVWCFTSGYGNQSATCGPSPCQTRLLWNVTDPPASFE